MPRTLDALSLSRDEEAIVEEKVEECDSQERFIGRYLPGCDEESFLEEKVEDRYYQGKFMERYLREVHTLSYLPIS
jgi:hypothetical protein